MANQDTPPGRRQVERGDVESHYVKNLALAAVAGQAGCAAGVIIMAALVAGLWLDSLINRRGPFTITLLICSVPVSLLVMVKIALGAVGRIVPQAQNQPRQT